MSLKNPALTKQFVDVLGTLALVVLEFISAEVEVEAAVPVPEPEKVQPGCRPQPTTPSSGHVAGSEEVPFAHA